MKVLVSFVKSNRAPDKKNKIIAAMAAKLERPNLIEQSVFCLHSYKFKIMNVKPWITGMTNVRQSAAIDCILPQLQHFKNNTQRKKKMDPADAAMAAQRGKPHSFLKTLS
jgi:hypothetical protein